MIWFLPLERPLKNHDHVSMMVGSTRCLLEEPCIDHGWFYLVPCLIHSWDSSGALQSLSLWLSFLSLDNLDPVSYTLLWNTQAPFWHFGLIAAWQTGRNHKKGTLSGGNWKPGLRCWEPGLTIVGWYGNIHMFSHFPWP